MHAETLLSFDEIDTPFGKFSILFNGDILYGISTELSGDFLEKVFPFYFAKSYLLPRVKRKRLPETITCQFEKYFSGDADDFRLNTIIDFDEAKSYFSEFELTVWKTLRRIPYGETRTYRWLAREIGRPSAQRAVGQALRRNPLPVVIPCHRIIGSNGSLCGYSLGLELKRRLLMHECYFSRLKPCPSH